MRRFIAVFLVLLCTLHHFLGPLAFGDGVLALVGTFGLFMSVKLPLRLLWLLTRRKPPPLSEVLLTWPTGDSFTLTDLVRSVAIFGMIGSGKTSGSGLALARAILGIRNSGGLICASKPEDREWWVRRFREAGRSDDLVIFAEDKPWRCNFIDVEMRAGADALGLTQFITTVGESINERGSGGQQNERFWRMSEQRMIYNAVEAVRQGLGRVSAPDIQQFIATAAYNQAQLANDKFLSGYHNQVMEAANRRPKTAIEARDFAKLCAYWPNEFVFMDPEPRGNVLAGVNNIFHTFTSGRVQEMVAMATNVTPADMDQGKWVLIDFPIARYDASGKFIMAGWKYLVQRHILRRAFKPGDSPIVIWSDECQNIINSYDGRFLDECRSHGGAMIYLTQTISNYYMAMGKENQPAVEVLLGQFGHKIFHAVDPVTAEWGSRLIGSTMQYTYSGNAPSPDNLLDAALGVGVWSSGLNEGVRPLLEPRELMTGLRTGGGVVDAYVVRPERFSDGFNFIKTAFSQN